VSSPARQEIVAADLDTPGSMPFMARGLLWVLRFPSVERVRSNRQRRPTAIQSEALKKRWARPSRKYIAVYLPNPDRRPGEFRG
jgi:hypothetical protein